MSLTVIIQETENSSPCLFSMMQTLDWKFGRIWKFMWTLSTAGEGLHKLSNSTKLSLECLHQVFFYKIRLGNMLWRHNRVCIAWYKHDSWPITASVRHNLFYKYNIGYIIIIIIYYYYINITKSRILGILNQ